MTTEEREKIVADLNRLKEQYEVFVNTDGKRMEKIWLGMSIGVGRAIEYIEGDREID